MKHLLALTLIACIIARGDVLSNPKSQQNFGESSRVRVTPDGVARGADRLVGCLEKVPIDASGRYRLSCEYRKADDATAEVAHGILGTVQYDARGRAIGGIQNGILPGSEAKVLKAVSRGAKAMELEANPLWADIIKKNLKRGYAAFLFAKRDFSDLPSASFCWITAQKLEDGKIIISAANFPAVPEGTLVRLHVSGWVSNGVELRATDKWQTACVEIQGAAAKATMRQWWKGASACSLAIFGKDVLFRDMKLERIE